MGYKDFFHTEMYDHKNNTSTVSHHSISHGRAGMALWPIWDLFLSFCLVVFAYQQICMGEDRKSTSKHRTVQEIRRSSLAIFLIAAILAYFPSLPIYFLLSSLPLLRGGKKREGKGLYHYLWKVTSYQHKQSSPNNYTDMCKRKPVLKRLNNVFEWKHIFCLFIIEIWGMGEELKKEWIREGKRKPTHIARRERHARKWNPDTRKP